MSPLEQSSPLEGIWVMVRAELDGEAAPELVVQNTTLEVSAGEYRVRFRGEVMDQGTIESSEAETKSLLLRGAVGTNSGRVIPCLYQLNGRRLRICYGLDGAPPSEFRTAAGAARYLATYRREDGPSSPER